MEKEVKRLEKIANDSLYCSGVNKDTIVYSYNMFVKHINQLDKILELGPAEGIGTDILYKNFSDITVVEGASIFCENLKEKYPKLNVINDVFENFSPRNKFDKIIIGHVMEHVEDAVEILKLVKKWLNPDGKVLCVVPNAMSLHRQAAVLMGLLQSEKDLNEMDIHHGHRRVYDPETLREDFLRAGFEIEHIGGYWIKPVSNRQIENSWTQEMLDAFMVLGEKYPEVAAEIFIIAK